MDDQDVQRIARDWISELDLSNIRNDLTPYIKKVNARLHTEDLGSGQSGSTVTIKGKTHITINSSEPEERQRFTVCHEIAHIVLGLPSQHELVPQWGYAKRDQNEVFCDIFAAELLMPWQEFQTACRDIGDLSLSAIQQLAEEFKTSYPAACSRFAQFAQFPCAFVTMESGRVRYAARSTALRRMGAKIPLKSPIHNASVAARLRGLGESGTQQDIVAQDIWFDDWEAGFDLTELARHYAKTDTTLSLIWFSEEETPRVEIDRFGTRVAEDEGLPELTGELSFPKRHRRR
ncbi:ImmA/IrrE family metallo-endopeptidase [Trinickia mobilis]|uniref:ImmA/IrrE family metallo-endopeptidase n=1 Tax=Trinickia mobilis TaxID=2816356 RepID=UPI001A8F2291|nr:ImmA/IrrE family metallo-endopeptidase [Trinickia mobilis]